MGLFSQPEVVVLKESSDSREYLKRLQQLLADAKGGAKERVMKEIAITTAGIAGEENVMFELKNSGMNLVVLHDLYIEANGLGAQIDFYVVTPKVNIVIECKNLIGNIEINSKGEFVRTFEYGGKKIRKGIYSPITQNERHMEVLKQCRREGLGGVLGAAFNATFDSINKSLVVLANPDTIMDDRHAPKDVKDKVIRADQLIATIKKIVGGSMVPPSSKKEMLEIGERMLARNMEERKDYFRKFDKLVSAVRDSGAEGTEPVELQKAQAKRCPKCGNELVLRTAAKGNNAGQKFYGCSKFPKCRYIENISGNC